jgi:hypothetical protein
MNERIKQLAEQAKDWAYAEHDGYTAQMLFEQKFAELIIGECADIAKGEPANFSDRDPYKIGRRSAGIDVLKHFGVE